MDKAKLMGGNLNKLMGFAAEAKKVSTNAGASGVRTSQQ